MGYCHCSSCRTWSASPVNGFTLWKPDSVKVIKGADQIGVFNKTDNSFRKWCKRCGGHLMTEHPQWGLIDVYAATIPDFPFRAGVHVNYQETVLPHGRRRAEAEGPPGGDGRHEHADRGLTAFPLPAPGRG